jgi:hypothetical protein
LQFKFYHKIYEDEREFEAFLASQGERERERERERGFLSKERINGRN